MNEDIKRLVEELSWNMKSELHDIYMDCSIDNTKIDKKTLQAIKKIIVARINLFAEHINENGLNMEDE
jgi:coproporphyrinogen III oxidase-like Fe-S oxidoreductase